MIYNFKFTERANTPLFFKIEYIIMLENRKMKNRMKDIIDRMDAINYFDDNQSYIQMLDWKIKWFHRDL